MTFALICSLAFNITLIALVVHKMDIIDRMRGVDQSDEAGC